VLAVDNLLIAIVLLVVFGVTLVLLNVRRSRSERLHQAELYEREQRLRLALWATGEYYWDFDLSTLKVSWLLGDAPPVGGEFGPPVALTSKPTAATIDIFELIHHEDVPRLKDTLNAYLNGQGGIFQAEFRTSRTVGWRWVRVRGRAISYDKNRQITRIAGTALDISATHTAERERQIASQVLRSMTEAVAVVDQEMNFISVNPAFLSMTGHESTEIIGYNMNMLNAPQCDPAQYSQIRQAIERDGHWSGELWQRRKNSEELLCTVTFNTIKTDRHVPQMHVVMFNDITKQKHTEQRLHYLTNFDSLTNLPNRSLLNERLPLTIVNARRKRRKVAVLFLDLDRFRDINDQFGPEIGDKILCAVARRLQYTVGAQQMVARLGGDEFAVIVGNLDDTEMSSTVAQKILAAFDPPLTLDDATPEVNVSFSIGISLYPDHALLPNELLKRADIAMYQAKAAGRRRFMRYDSKMEQESQQRVILARTLRKVLERSELQLMFQPRLELNSSRITGVEVLLRWFSHEHGEIDPADFIPLAEESGMIMEIGKWALNEACLTLQNWRQQGLLDLMISVNISLLQLLHDDFPEMIQGILHSTGTPPETLELELTESMLMVDIGHAANRLQVFRDMGVSVAVDDFGTGYSSLAYLKRLPVNTIKIDKTFIKDLTHESKDDALAASIIHMGHSLGMRVVAEGVETDAQRQFLLRHDCDEIQGYWLAKPMRTEQALTFIRHWPPPPRSFWNR